MSTSSSITQLQQLASLWEQEQRAVHQRYVEERQTLTLEERVARGVALRQLDIIETDAALGGRVMFWLASAKLDELDAFRGGPGTPVRLWIDHPDSAEAVLGTLSRRRNDRIGVVVDEFPDALEAGSFQLDRDEPQSTFVRGKKAIQRFQEAEKNTPLLALREVLFGLQPPNFGKVGERAPGQPFDQQLNEPQWEAITHALCAEQLALIHGPPGTGKTRVLVEVIRQAVAQGQRVLASAASNAAVDNLAERLATVGLQVVRLGHPARVSPEMEAHTLDAMVEQTEEYKLSRKWIIEANALRRKIATKRARGELRRQERRELVQEMRGLFRDARQQIQHAQDSILGRAQVVCSTAAGADVGVMGDLHFDLVVLDEATQATDPIALVACTRGERVVMAGDPCQLPPTVIDLDAERAGLGRTFFERLAAQEAQDALRMLTVQYRMHEAIMQFPSEQMYDGQLQAAPDVALHRLHQLEGVCEDPLRDAPFLFLDTSGKGWEEARREDDPSTSNPLQAERTAAEVTRLLSRGLTPHDVAVITPYRAQVQLLRSLLSDAYAQGLEIDSVDGFQGREKEAIVFDLVRSNDAGMLGFVNDTRRMNVALTRARRFLMVIGDSATLGLSHTISALLEHAEQHDAYLSAWNDDAPPL